MVGDSTISVIAGLGGLCDPNLGLCGDCDSFNWGSLKVATGNMDTESVVLLMGSLNIAWVIALMFTSIRASGNIPTDLILVTLRISV
uniref:Uncharacterized protein n=1 Tax=Romanomermis culicivorax TaxID=13658 RepID=A0A915KYC5_ROMCU